MTAKPRALSGICLLACVLATASVPASAQESDGTAEDGWRDFRHSSGAVLSHPSDWQVVEQPGGISLQAPNAGTNEFIVATGMAANGTTDPAAPEVGGYLDNSMMQMFPGLERTAGPEPVSTANGEGFLYRYTGTLLFDGSDVASHVYVTIQDNVAYTLSAIGPPGVIDLRAPTLAKIFASIGSGVSSSAGATGAAAGNSAPSGGSTAITDDPRLVGMFAGEARAGGADVGIYVNTRLVYVLNPDGTLYYGGQSYFSASKRDYNQELIYTAHGNTDDSVDRGRWSAANGFLTLEWESGQRSYFAYGFEPDGSLVLRNPQTRKLINFYTRVR